MSAAEKKPCVCPRCKASGAGATRTCDVDGCGRPHCAHMGKRVDGKDTCGPCNLAQHRAAKKAATP